MQAEAGESSRARILVADDSNDSREVCAEIFASWGFEVTTAADGQEAIESARQLRPDLIVMDLSMPVLDGWEAARRLRADLALRTVPLIALTAHSHPDVIQEALRAGFDLVATKPCPPRELKEMIMGLLARASARAASAGRATLECGDLTSAS